VHKLIRGVADFVHRKQPAYRAAFRGLAHDQRPRALLLTCSDSRIVSALLFGADPGDLFEVRTVGNLIAPAGADAAESVGDQSEAAAVEYALLVLSVPHVLIMGHSNCGAMKAVLHARVPPEALNLSRWLAHAGSARAKLEQTPSIDPALPTEDRLSQANVLGQLDHLRSYRVVGEALARGVLQLHGAWFDVGRAELHAWRDAERRFVRLDAGAIARFLTPTG
jgi:carbonic anhydrase